MILHHIDGKLGIDRYGCNLYSLFLACEIENCVTQGQRDSVTFFFLAENKQIAHNLVNAVCNAVGPEN